MSESRHTIQPGRHAQRLPAGVVLVFLAVALLGAMVISCGSGYIKVPFGDVLRSIADLFTGG